MNKSAAFDLGFQMAMRKQAEFGQKATEGAMKTIGGVTKKLVDGKWVEHKAPGVGEKLVSGLKGLLGGGGASSTAPIVRSVNVAKARAAKLAEDAGAATQSDG